MFIPCINQGVSYQLCTTIEDAHPALPDIDLHFRREGGGATTKVVTKEFVNVHVVKLSFVVILVNYFSVLFSVCPIYVYL